MQTRRGILAVIAGAPLAGCSMFTNPPVVTPGAVASVVATICGYVVDLAAVAALIPTFPIGTIAATIATAICAAINRPAIRQRGPLTVVVNGVKTVGSYVVVNGVTIPFAVR